MKFQNILIIFLFILLFFGCGFYERIVDYKGCKEYYGLSTKNYKTKFNSDAIVDSWKKDGYEIIRDTFYTDDEKWMSPQAKILNYKHPEIKVEINYILMTVAEFKRRTDIQLHGICLKKRPDKFLSRKELKKINEIIRKEFIGRFKER